jgi:hypothetical protein
VDDRQRPASVPRAIGDAGGGVGKLDADPVPRDRVPGDRHGGASQLLSVQGRPWRSSRARRRSDFLAQLPQHTKLLGDFDRQLAAIAVPQAAAAKARALAAYVAFASKLDAARLRAARQGAAAYQREIGAEQKSAASAPSITARNAAGFSPIVQRALIRAGR